ncbi:MAG: tRNA (adenosine(37)-N6)-dimethylallyltransferase MiaA [Lachnospiraceae bacterium]|nr:tRNA (adenosine(37)-N6)-dimethylallyltransferase MiaA [Lachnospiraceae bacterium]
MSKKPSVIVLTGPTAVGKTQLSLRLASELVGEILSADSMQVYRGMDIGTAKASPRERALVPHHLIDVADPGESFSVADYVRLAEPVLQDILRRGKVPLIVGGTGFYIQALLKGIDFSESETEGAERKRLWERGEREGWESLYRELEQVDPSSVAALHPNNKKRLVRALEYYYESGEPLSELNRRQKAQESPYRSLYLVLNLPREELYARIEARVQQMLQEGLPQEVRRLISQGLSPSSTALQALGYKEWMAAERGEISPQEAQARIVLGSRHYAKRQLTWFRREKEAVWIKRKEYKTEEELYRSVLQLCRSFLNQEENE